MKNTFRRFRWLFCTVAVFGAAIVLVTPQISSTSAQSTQGGQPWGSWLWLTLGPGFTGQNVAIFHQDGSMTCAEGPFAGYEETNEAYGPGHGTWEKTGPNTFRGVRYVMVYDKTTGVRIGISRGRFSFHFVPGNFDQIEGRLFVELLGCPDGPFACPDPLDPANVWTPASPPEGLPASAKRIHTVPVD